MARVPLLQQLRLVQRVARRLANVPVLVTLAVRTQLPLDNDLARLPVQPMPQPWPLLTWLAWVYPTLHVGHNRPLPSFKRRLLKVVAQQRRLVVVKVVLVAWVVPVVAKKPNQLSPSHLSGP